MSRIVEQAFITLDGVVQGGSAPDEDREGGFEQGGWQMDYDDQLKQGRRGGESSCEVASYSTCGGEVARPHGWNRMVQ